MYNKSRAIDSALISAEASTSFQAAASETICTVPFKGNGDDASRREQQLTVAPLYWDTTKRRGVAESQRQQQKQKQYVGRKQTCRAHGGATHPACLNAVMCKGVIF